MSAEAAPEDGADSGGDDIQDPPVTIGGILRRLGPGLIIAGSIVGSGELIATTAVGAEAGFWLLWLILIGCVIKVFTQVELGRFSIVTGETTMAGMKDVPGPRLGRHGNWLVWYWLLMFVVSLAQLGGIVGGVGQAMAISLPITEAGRQYNAIVDVQTELRVKERYLELIEAQDSEARAEELAELRADIAEVSARVSLLGEKPESVYDARIWATVITVISAVILVVGRYGLIQTFSTILVAAFTLITIVNLLMLQANDTLAVTPGEFVDGLKFRLPPPAEHLTRRPLTTALATFGIIGVGATELIQYPYWCLEKGYARFAGPRDASAQWAARARGWMRVMRWDAWCSMVVYTFATIAFYLVGAATLGRFDLSAEGTEMVRTLAVMYEPVFGDLAPALFLFGAIAVLYSTFFVANAGHARVSADALRVFGVGTISDAGVRMWVRIFSGLFPFLCLSAYLWVQAPVTLVLASGVMQAIMLPMLGAAALYFRYRRSDRRLLPGRAWDLMLWLSSIGMLATGIAVIYLKVEEWLGG